MAMYGNDKKGELNLRHLYPLTIIPDRYNGTYSGGLYTVWKHHAENVPSEIYSDDTTCSEFWSYEVENRNDFGVGDTIQEAIDDLYYKSSNPLIYVKNDMWFAKQNLENLYENNLDYNGGGLSCHAVTSREAYDALERFNKARREFKEQREKKIMSKYNDL